MCYPSQTTLVVYIYQYTTSIRIVFKLLHCTPKKLPANLSMFIRRSTQGQSLTPLSGQNQGRYKGLTPAPGYVKFSMWKRETEIPKISFYEYIINKIRGQEASKAWIRDVSNGRTETFGQVSKSVDSIASGLNKIGQGFLFCSQFTYPLLELKKNDLYPNSNISSFMYFRKVVVHATRYILHVIHHLSST